MCRPTWPTKIGRQAFVDYATEVHGWTPERAGIAWKWVIARQVKIDAEAEEAARRVREAAPRPVFPSNGLPDAGRPCPCNSCQGGG